jgi:signal transduction histidine kinase
VHVEDSPDDAELVQRALRVGGFAATLTRVETEAELVAVLRSGPPDVILSDYSLPRFSGLDVLRLTRLFSPETPVIVVSGTIGEDRAAEILREGAIDYVLKDRLARLVPAVERALREAEERRVRQRLEEQLFQAQKMEALGRLAGGVAHDFNNLLTVILGYGSLVAGQVARDPDAARNLEQMLLAGERAAGLTRQLLSFSRKQVGQPRLIDVNIVVQEIERMLRRLIGEDIDLHSVLAPDLWRVLADMGQIEQVIVNLAVNARDAMPEGGKLTIETANVDLGAEYAAVHAEVQPGQYVLLAVTDTGTGMDAETQRRIFEPFFTTKEPGKGTGLGLATCYAIVRQSGGHLWVYSEPGRGASFKVYLPRAEGGPAVAVDGPAPPPAGGAETILLVEDDETVCFLARTVLEGRGYHVLAAPDSATALELVAAHAEGIALLVADLVMPGLSGPDLARRAAERIPGLRVLLMSGYAADAVVRHGVLAPGAAFLQKPFTPDALARKVREMLDG